MFSYFLAESCRENFMEGLGLESGEVYVKMFDGTSTLFLATHAGVDISKFRMLGTVISHAYLVGGVLPDRVAFSCLAAAFLGP